MEEDIVLGLVNVQKERQISLNNETDITTPYWEQVLSMCEHSNTHWQSVHISEFTRSVKWRACCGWCVSSVGVFYMSVVIGRSGFGCILLPWTRLSFIHPARNIIMYISSLSSQERQTIQKSMRCHSLVVFWAMIKLQVCGQEEDNSI